MANALSTIALGWILLVLALVGLHRVFTGHERSRDSALHTLNDRFAGGEIGDAEYKAKRDAILKL
jgi:uncharacterized membrane protein